MIAGGGAVLMFDQLWLRSWAASGYGFPIGQRLSVELPQGQSLVYYESPFSVPAGDATLYLWDSDGERQRVNKPDDDISYRLLWGGWSGRALWRVDVPTAGRYSFLCANHNFADDRDIPAEDRVVFVKTPDSLNDVNQFRKITQVTGATATVTVAALCYIIHGRALRRRRKGTGA